jgi:serine/threonine-protein kinase HipA
MDRSDQLRVYLEEELVGSIYDASPLVFQYATTWLARAEPLPIAAIALVAERQESGEVQSFFENLLPEGELRQFVAEKKKASTLFSMLLEVAGDTAGAFVILPPEQLPERATYELTSWDALAALLADKSAAAIDIAGQDARISLAGAQDKASIAIFDDGVPRLPRGTAPSTHILKPDIKRIAKVWQSAANEAIVMLAAAHCGMPTAEVFYEPHTQSCIVRRFDRYIRADDSLGRLIQYDLCQLAGIVSAKKYEKEGGPGITDCADLIRKYSTQPVTDLRNYVNWIFFNLFVGNNDSHAKNLSVYHVPGKGVALTPFYDLMSTRLYPGLSPEFAFSIGGETRPGSVTREHVIAMAKELRMQPRFVLAQAAALAAKMPAAIDQAVSTVTPMLSPGAHDLADRLKTFVLSTTKKTATRLAG